VTPVVNLKRDRPLHPWVRTPDELDDDLVVRPLRQTRRLALMNGWTIEEADNLTAWRDGLNGHQHWTLKQVLDCDALRWAAEHGRLGGARDGAP
jgi:hypothetical protein